MCKTYQYISGFSAENQRFEGLYRDLGSCRDGAAAAAAAGRGTELTGGAGGAELGCHTTVETLFCRLQINK